MQSLLGLTFLLLLGLCSGLRSSNTSGLDPPADKWRPSVQFVPSNLQNHDKPEGAETLQCDNEPVELFDGSAFHIQRRNPIRTSCPYNFQVQEGVAVDVMCIRIHVPCRRNTAITISSSGSEPKSSYCTNKGVEKRVRISLKAFDEVTNLRLEHEVNGRRGGRGFSCIVRGLGGAQDPNGKEQRVEMNPEINNNSTAIQSRLNLDCGRTRYTRIINGGFASDQEYPWMAALVLGGSLCGGSLINQQWILTAAHCSVGLGPWAIKAYLGCQIIVCQGSNGRSISSNIIPSIYDGGAHDIALLRLSSPLISFSNAIRPVCLTSNLVPDGTRLWASGWGRTENGAFSSWLKEALVATMSDATCRLIPDRFPIVCTRTITGNTCNGDSGSPLVFARTRNGVQRLVQYALVSFGEATCNVNIESANTEVPYYINFIQYYAGSIQIVN